jgi:hypothetical protein
MSLKAFHVVFIAASILLALGFGGWALDQYFASGERPDLWVAAGSFAVGLGLIAYGVYVVRKLRNVSYL